MIQQGLGATRYIGRRMPRKEDPRLLTGRGQFVDDIVLPGLLHVAFTRSPIARGRILSIDTSIARDAPGVHAIYTFADFASRKVKMLSFYLVGPDIDIPPLANDRVVHVGDPVALIIADTRAMAEDAAALVDVQYAEESPVVTIADARRGAPVHLARADNVAAQMGDEDADEELEALLIGAAHLVTHKIAHQRISHSPMETRGIVAVREGPEELTLYITCQSPHMIARWVSLAFDLPKTAIRVIAKDVGGSFGLKNHPWREEVSVIIASLLFGRPLKWIEDRYENLIASNQAREAEMTLRTGFTADGRLVASHGDYSCNNGAYPQGPDANMAVHMFVWACYKMPAYAFLTRGWYTNTVGLCAYRGPWAMESLIRETTLDIAARRLGLDPVEIRRRNLVTLKDQPTTTSIGIPLADITPAECLEKLLAHIDVDAFRAEQARLREEGRHIGLGIATYIEPTGAAGAIPTMTGELAQVRVDPTGKVIAMMSTHSQGHGTATTMAQIIADRLGVPYDDVTVFEGDSSRGGFSPGAAGSRQGVIAGGAAIKASELLVAKIKQLAAHLFNASPERIRVEEGLVHVEGAPEMTRPLSEIANIAYGEPTRLPEGFEPGLECQYRYQPPPMTFTSAAHACMVEVCVETGFVKIVRWVSSEDCGTVINPAVVEGQIAGGLAQAIGMVLLEEMPFDRRGNPCAATYKDYLLPTLCDIPEFEFVHANTPSQSVGGMRGVGEGGAIIGPPTLVNAIADALAPFGELSPLNLPLTPAKILGVIEHRNFYANTARAEPEREASLTMPDPQPPEATEPIKASVKIVIDGDWAMVLASPAGPQEMTAHFQTNGASLSGYLSNPQGRQHFEGSVEGQQLRFDLKVEKPVKLTLKYDVAINGDVLAGKVKMGVFGTAKLTGKRI